MTYYFVIALACTLAGCLLPQRKLAALAAGAVLIIFAGTRMAVDNDYLTYASIFASPELAGTAYGNAGVSLEPSYYFVPKLAAALGGNQTETVRYCFLIFALLGVSAKLLGILQHSRSFFLSLCVYATYLFLVQEMTAIRAGVASGIFLLSFGFYIRREKIMFAAMMIPAFLFHSSSILFVLAWLLHIFRIRTRVYLAGLAVAFVIAVLRVNIVSAFRLDEYFPRVAVYLQMESWSTPTTVNIFNLRVIFSLIAVAVFGFYYRKFSEIRGFVELYRIHILSLIVFFSLSPSASVFSLRSYELLSVVQVLLYPMAVIPLRVREKLLGHATILFICAVQMWYLVSVAGIFKPYSSWL